MRGHGVIHQCSAGASHAAYSMTLRQRVNCKLPPPHGAPQDHVGVCDFLRQLCVTAASTPPLHYPFTILVGWVVTLALSLTQCAPVAYNETQW